MIDIEPLRVVLKHEMLVNRDGIERARIPRQLVREDHGRSIVAAQVVSALQTIPSRMNNAADPIVLSIGTIHGGNRFKHHRRRGDAHRHGAHAQQGGPDRVRTLMNA